MFGFRLMCDAQPWSGQLGYNKCYAMPKALFFERDLRNPFRFSIREAQTARK
jgi:hypothetical protein